MFSQRCKAFPSTCELAIESFAHCSAEFELVFSNIYST